MPNAVMTKLKKTDYIPFLDTSSDVTASWMRIDKSTIFALNPNPQTNTYNYISTETPVTEVDHYEPALPQEIALYQGNPIYDFIFDKFYNLPVGSACEVPLLMAFGGTEKKAWLCTATIVLGELNTVDGKISFTLNIGGNITKGTYTITDGAPSFTAAASAT